MERWRKSRRKCQNHYFIQQKKGNEANGPAFTTKWQQKTAKTLPLCAWGYSGKVKCSFNEELFNYIMEQRFANAQQWTCWQSNRKEFISGSRIVLAAYSFPAEGLQITSCLCEVAQLCQPAIPAAPNIAGAAPPSSDSHMPGNLPFAAPNTLAATKAFPGWGLAGSAPHAGGAAGLQHQLTHSHLARILHVPLAPGFSHTSSTLRSSATDRGENSTEI